MDEGERVAGETEGEADLAGKQMGEEEGAYRRIMLAGLDEQVKRIAEALGLDELEPRGDKKPRIYVL